MASPYSTTSPGDTSLKSAAIEYALRGFSVFPIKEASKSPSLIKGWPDNASKDVPKLNHWWSMWPTANIGIVTGKASGFFVLDVDNKSSGQDSLAALLETEGPLPETAIQETGNGRHILFKCSEPIKNSASKIAPGLDIRGDRGYIVAAPSKHPSGNYYEWHTTPNAIAEPPDWLLARVAANGKSEIQSQSTDTIPEGKRNESLFKIGCTLKAKGVKAIEITGELQRINRLRCKPPLPDSEVTTIAGNVNRKLSQGTLPLFRFRDFVRTSTPRDPTLRHILHAISFYMDANGKPCYPTTQRIADDTGYSRETVSRKLKDAVQAGLIVKTSHAFPGQRYSNNVYLLPDRFYR